MYQDKLFINKTFSSINTNKVVESLNIETVTKVWPLSSVLFGNWAIPNTIMVLKLLLRRMRFKSHHDKASLFLLN